MALVTCALVWTTSQTSSQFSETIERIRLILFAEHAGLRSGFNLPMSTIDFIAVDNQRQSIAASEQARSGLTVHFR
jgi:hypothetical protein